MRCRAAAGRALVVTPLVAALAAAASCGGSSTPTAAPTTTSPSSLLSSAPGGLVGVIDRARVLSVCANLRQAQTALDAGFPRAQVDEFVIAAADLLDRPPRVRAAVALATTVRVAVRRHAEATAVRAGMTWCRAEGA